MKIFFTLLLTCVFGVSSLIAQNKSETDKERDDLRGAVKKVETYLIDFLLQGDVIVEKKRPWVMNSYNAKGNLSERTVFQQNGELNTDVYIYDAEGRNVECRTYSNAADKALEKYQKYVHKFDDNGNMIERIITESDGSPSSRFTYKYDAKDNKIEERNYYYTGVLGGKTIFTYNDNGEMTSRAGYEGESAFLGKSVFIYDIKRKTIKEMNYLREFPRYEIFTLMDEKGRVIQRETLYFNKNSFQGFHAPKPGKVIFIYDEKGKLKEGMRFDKNGLLEVFSTFDGKDNEIESIWYEPGGSFEEIMQAKNKSSTDWKKLLGIFKSKMTEQFEYDAQGNWTKKTRLYQTQENEQPKSWQGEYRIISYY